MLNLVCRAETLIRVTPVEVIVSFSFFQSVYPLVKIRSNSSFCNLVDNSIGSKVRLFMILDHFPLKVQCIIFLQILIFCEFILLHNYYKRIFQESICAINSNLI